MSIPLSTIKSTLRTIVLNATGYPESKVIIANQNAPKPVKPYITINPVLTVSKTFLDDMEEMSLTEKTIFPVRDITASIHGFGDNSLTALSNIMTYLERFQGVELLRNNQIGLLNRGDFNIKDLSSNIDDNLYVEHSQMDLTLQVQGDDIIDDTYGSVTEISSTLNIAYDGANTDTDPTLIRLESNLPIYDSSYEGLNAPINIDVEATVDGFTLTFEEG